VISSSSFSLFAFFESCHYFECISYSIFLLCIPLYLHRILALKVWKYKELAFDLGSLHL
jgi:hypothetical protein